MKEKVNAFASLHQGSELLVIGNVWNAQSAQVFKKLEFKAIGTSSAAVAATLGYQDGEAMPFSEYLFVVERIARTCDLPLTVDLEAGYGKDADEVVENIKKLSALGVVGVNMEDSHVTDGKRTIDAPNVFAGKLKAIADRLSQEQVAMFLNIRCDAFLLGLPDATQEAVLRAQIYDKAGASGLFFPCVIKIDDVKSVVAATTLPVNVMCMPGLPTFQELQHAGVKRISMGNFLNAGIYQSLEERVTRVMRDGSFASLF